MQLVEQHIIRYNHCHFNELDFLCYLSKNLYNTALYELRQHYFETKTYLNKYELINKLTKTKQSDYTVLPAKVSQQVIFQVDNAFKIFFKLFKLKQSKIYNKKIHIPNYLNKRGKNILTYTNQNLSTKYLKKGIIKLPKSNIQIKTSKQNINQVRIIPKGNHIVVEIIYTVQEQPLKQNNNRYCSIDLGLNNLVTVGSNVLKPIIINGKPLKSINQYYNKKKASLQSKLKDKFISKRIQSLNLKRNNKIKDYMHKASHLLTNHLVSNHINTLIIGYNKEWKQEVNMGKKTNQSFVNIPYLSFINMLQYKCKLQGINVIIREESYTSKCSFIDDEEVCYHDEYLGERIKRGLFKASNGRYINADLNGALNILKKEVPNVFSKGYGKEVCSTPIVYTIK